MRAWFERPIVFLAGGGDIPMSVRAMRAGAVNFLTKPVATRGFWGASGLRWRRIS